MEGVFYLYTRIITLRRDTYFNKMRHTTSGVRHFDGNEDARGWMGFNLKNILGS